MAVKEIVEIVEIAREIAEEGLTQGGYTDRELWKKLQEAAPDNSPGERYLGCANGTVSTGSQYVEGIRYPRTQEEKDPGTRFIP